MILHANFSVQFCFLTFKGWWFNGAVLHWFSCTCHPWVYRLSHMRWFMGDSDYSHVPIKQLVLNVAVTVFASRKLVKSCPNPKRISYSIELMVQMLLILSISDARSSHRLILRMSPWMWMASCNLFQDFPKMSHDLRQHKCAFTVCKIANPYIFA